MMGRTSSSDSSSSTIGDSYQVSWGSREEYTFLSPEFIEYGLYRRS